MITHLPEDVQAGLDAARLRAFKKSNRLRIEVDGVRYRVLRSWEGGFAVAAKDAPPLRGLVDLFDGPRHIARCLIVATSVDAEEITFDFKQSTHVTGEQPLDFFRAPDAPSR